MNTEMLKTEFTAELIKINERVEKSRTEITDLRTSVRVDLVEAKKIARLISAIDRKPRASKQTAPASL